MHKALPWLIAVCLLGYVLPMWAAEDDDDDDDDKPDVGHTEFIAFEGEQNWPTADTATVIKDFAVPIYMGLPRRRYKILGRIYDERSGIEILGKAFDEGLASERGCQRDCANQAKLRAADAVLVTNDPKIVEAFKLDAKKIRSTAPLFDHKDKLVLAIKFD